MAFALATSRRAVCHLRQCREQRGAPAVVRYRKGDGSREEKGNLTLYTSVDTEHGGVAPESQSVLIALLEKKIPFREERVNMAAKPTEFIELYHSIIPDKDVRERSPVLVNGSQRLVDAAAIIDYLSGAYPDSGTPLTPQEPYSAARVKLFVNYFMDHVVPAFNHLVHAVDPVILADAREQLLRALAAVDEFLALHGAGEDYAVGPHYGWSMSSLAGEEQAQQAAPREGLGPHEHYLMGPFYSNAEVFCTPFIARMVEVLPEWRGIDVLAECQARRLHRVEGWMKACLARPSAQLTSPKRKELVEGLVEWEWSHAV